MRISEARDELQAMIKEDELRDATILVYANKQDLPDAMDASELTEKLGLHSVRGHDWYIQETCATTGEGLFEGMIDYYLFLINRVGMDDQGFEETTMISGN